MCWQTLHKAECKTDRRTNQRPQISRKWMRKSVEERGNIIWLCRRPEKQAEVKTGGKDAKKGRARCG